MNGWQAMAVTIFFFWMKQSKNGLSVFGPPFWVCFVGTRAVHPLLGDLDCPFWGSVNHDISLDTLRYFDLDQILK